VGPHVSSSEKSVLRTKAPSTPRLYNSGLIIIEVKQRENITDPSAPANNYNEIPTGRDNHPIHGLLRHGQLGRQVRLQVRAHSLEEGKEALWAHRYRYKGALHQGLERLEG
jgi:hypothetical protein